MVEKGDTKLAEAGNPEAGVPRAPTPGVRRLRGVATVLDSAAKIPGTDIRFGLDALLGLIPGVGDVAGGLASGFVLVESARLGASHRTLVRMLGNIVVEVLVGAAPILGDLFDVGWKANARNVDLLEAELASRAREGRSPTQVGRLFVGGLLLVLLLTVLGVLWIIIALVGSI